MNFFTTQLVIHPLFAEKLDHIIGNLMENENIEHILAIGQNPEAFDFIEKTLPPVLWNMHGFGKNTRDPYMLIKAVRIRRIPIHLLDSPNVVHLLELPEFSQHKAQVNSKYPESVPFLSKEENFQYINWTDFSENPKAIDLLRENRERIDWRHLCCNPGAIELLEEENIIPKLGEIKEVEQQFWLYLSMNPHPRIQEWFRYNLDKVHWSSAFQHFPSDLLELGYEYTNGFNPSQLTPHLLSAEMRNKKIGYSENAKEFMMIHPDMCNWSAAFSRFKDITYLYDNWESARSHELESSLITAMLKNPAIVYRQYTYNYNEIVSINNELMNEIRLFQMTQR